MKKSVPIGIDTINDNNINDVIDIFKKINADEVIFAVFPYDEIDKYEPVMKKYQACFEDAGIEVDIWIDTLSSFRNKKYQMLTDLSGNTSDCACPLCAEFVRDYCEYVQRIAKIGIRKIVLEDDFRMHVPSIEAACFCDEHMKLYSKILGEAVTKEIMGENILNNTQNKYKTAWLEGNRISLESIAKKIREAVDSVDPEIDIMLCAGPAVFGADGTDAIALAKIFSSAETPEMRLIGAPYWQNGFHLVNNMMSAVDYTRHQALVCKKNNITTIAEGDPYPRPRHTVPASHLETFHTAILADGNFDKIQKYVLDYYSSPSYELGYVKADVKNQQLYRDIERIFKGKKDLGINLVEPFDGIRKYAKIPKLPERGVINSSGRDFLNLNSFPAIFEQEGVNLIFGENARCVERESLKNGAILDIEAAKIFMDAGIDVGIESYQDAESQNNDACDNPNTYEYYYDYDEKVGVYGEVNCCVLALKEGCEVSSVINSYGKENIGSYFYQNASGERFFVHNFNAETDSGSFGLFKSYCRQKQLIKAYEMLNGSKFEAVCTGNPDLYMMVKKDADSMAIGLWNYFADSIDQPFVELSQEYAEAEFINCSGRLEDDKVIITSGIPAYGFCFIELKSNR